jgi:hypothetical protein
MVILPQVNVQTPAMQIINSKITAHKDAQPYAHKILIIMDMMMTKSV